MLAHHASDVHERDVGRRGRRTALHLAHDGCLARQDEPHRELDFRIEAAVAEQVRTFLRDDQNAVVPRAHPALTTARVLTTDLIRGVPPRPRAELEALGLDADALLAAGARAMLRQVFELGLFHADPHPGNLLLLPGNRVCFLDFGLHGRVEPRERRRMAMLLYALGNGDFDGVVDQLLHLSYRAGSARAREFKVAAAELVGSWYTRTTPGLAVGRLLLGYLGLGARYGIEFPRDLLLLARALVHLEATVTLIDPETSVEALLAPLLPEARHALMPSRTELEHAWAGHWMDYVALLSDLPEALPHLAGLLDPVSRDAPAEPPRAPRGPWTAAASGAAAGALAAVLLRRGNSRTNLVD